MRQLAVLWGFLLFGWSLGFASFAANSPELRTHLSDTLCTLAFFAGCLLLSIGLCPRED